MLPFVLQSDDGKHAQDPRPDLAPFPRISGQSADSSSPRAWEANVEPLKHKTEFSLLILVSVVIGSEMSFPLIQIFPVSAGPAARKWSSVDFRIRTGP